jgi:hypothetical protein
MATQNQKNVSDLGEQAIALAEQLGRIAGTIEGAAESWMDRRKLTEQLTRVRDNATKMLEGLTGSVAKAPTAVRGKKKAAPMAATRQADPSRAPGKRHRKPGPTLHGVKKSDETIPKMRVAAAVRQRRKSYA